MPSESRDQGSGTGTPKCPKCRGCLTHLVEINELQAEQVVKCIQCGWRISRPAPVGYQDIPLMLVKGNLFGSDHMQMYMTGTCKVQGCAAPLRFDNESGLCKKHRGMESTWSNSGHRNHPPFVPSPEIAGALMVNPLRKQRISIGR